VNDVLQDIQIGTGGMSIIYGEQGGNLIEVIATDTAGNSSAPGTITVTISG
jgi:hypothetical protein